MRYKEVLKIIGILFAMFSLSLLPPAVISYFAKDGSFGDFVISFLAIFLVGVAIWYPVRKHRKPLGPREGFLIVAAFWTSLVLAGTLPFLLSHDLEVGFVDAFFESTSGLTTTGATILTGIDELPKSVLYYRQQLQWRMLPEKAYEGQ